MRNTGELASRADTVEGICWLLRTRGRGDTIRLRVENDALVLEETYGDRTAISDTILESPSPARAKFHARDRMILVDGPYKGARGEFLRGPDGRIAWLRMSRVYARQEYGP